MKTIQFISLLGVLCIGACSSIERGVVVGKGHTVKSVAEEPTHYYWVDVRGKNQEGIVTTERVQLFKQDWERFGEGDAISPHDFDMIGAARALSVSVKKVARIGGTPTPQPTTPKAQPKRRPARVKSPPSTPAPKTARSRPALETEASREAKFRNVEARAHGDADVRELKRKIQNAKTNEEQAAAWQEHRRALFQKMRELEPSVKDRIDQAENSGR